MPLMKSLWVYSRVPPMQLVCGPVAGNWDTAAVILLRSPKSYVVATIVMEETGIAKTASAVLLLLVAFLNLPCLSADRRISSSPLSSTGYHDPYKFAYAIKKPLPFHSNFGQTQLSVESTTVLDVYSKRERTPRRKPEAQEEEISLDESSFGDRIIPRTPTGRQVPKKSSKQIDKIVDNHPSKSDEKKEESNQKLIDSFFSTFSVPTPAPAAPARLKEPEVTTKDTPRDYEEPVRPKQSRKRVKVPVKTEVPVEDSYTGSEYAESVNNQFVSLSSDNIRSNQELQVEHKGFDSPELPAIVNAESNTPVGLEYSYFVFGSSSTPEQFADKLRDVPIPSFEEEVVGKDVGSPGSVSSSIDDLYNKFSPFSPEGFGRPSVSSPPSITENTAERPIVAKSQFSSDIAPFVQSVSSELPPFVPSPPVYPSPPTRDLFTTSASDGIEPFPKPRFPEPTKIAGFVPSANGDTFTQFPKPNFAPFHPPPSTETVYYGGVPNEPPAHPILQNNVINFIKTNAGSENALRPSTTFPQYPTNGNQFGNPSAIQNIQNNFAQLQNGHVRSPAPSPVNSQPLRPPPIANSVGPSAQKPNFPPAPPRPNIQAKPVGFNPNLAALPPSSTISGQSLNGVKHWSDPSPVRTPAAPSPVLTAPKQNAPAFIPAPVVKPFVASQQLSTRPLTVPAAPQVTRPQQFNHISPQHSGKSPVQSAKPGAFTGFTNFAPFTPGRNPSAPLSSAKPPRSASPAAAPRPHQIPSAFSPQINQVLPSLTRNPAPVPVLAPMPLFLRPATLTLPTKPVATRQVSKSYSAPLAKPIYYHAFVTYG